MHDSGDRRVRLWVGGNARKESEKSRRGRAEMERINREEMKRREREKMRGRWASATLLVPQFLLFHILILPL
uniref:IBB domain-containing protein n=1 Tax=Macrostomum lignano TaxID=282301 RepID=A0A1I8FJA1_9PLAT